MNPARRRLLKGGAAATPLLWAIATRPARAAFTECQSPSAWGSMHASGPNSTVQVCSGRSCEYWQDSAHFDKWPHPYYPTTDASLGGYTASAFHATGCRGGHFGGKTMLEVLQMSGEGGYANMGAHITAALLNAAAGMTPVLTVPQVLELWNDCSGQGYYEPTAGVRWGPEEVVTYLRSTMAG